MAEPPEAAGPCSGDGSSAMLGAAGTSSTGLEDSASAASTKGVEKTSELTANSAENFMVSLLSRCSKSVSEPRVLNTSRRWTAAGGAPARPLLRNCPATSMKLQQPIVSLARRAQRRSCEPGKDLLHTNRRKLRHIFKAMGASRGLGAPSLPYGAGPVPELGSTPGIRRAGQVRSHRGDGSRARMPALPLGTLLSDSLPHAGEAGKAPPAAGRHWGGQA